MTNRPNAAAGWPSPYVVAPWTFAPPVGTRYYVHSRTRGVPAGWCRAKGYRTLRRAQVVHDAMTAQFWALMPPTP